MSTNLTKTLLEGALKVKYPDKDQLRDATLSKQNLLKKIKSPNTFIGKLKQIPWLVENPYGASADYVTALANNGPSSTPYIYIEPTALYQQIGLTTQVIKSSTDEQLVDAAKSEAERGVNALGNSLAYHFYRSSSGEVGNIGTSTDTSTTTLYFSSRADVFDLKKGEKLVFASTARAALRSATALTIVSIDRGAGSVVLSATPDSLAASITVGDYIFRKGTAYNNNAVVLPYGLTDYIPLTAPYSGDSFTGAGLDRSADTRMSGVRVDGSDLTVEAGLIDLAAEIGFNRGNMDTVAVNNRQYASFAKQMQTQVFYDEVRSEGRTVGMRQPKVILGPLTSDIVIDPNCPEGYAFGLTMDTWEIVSYGKWPEVLDTDGNTFRQSTSFDGVNMLIASYTNYACYAPWSNGRLSLPSLG